MPEWDPLLAACALLCPAAWVDYLRTLDSLITGSPDLLAAVAPEPALTQLQVAVLALFVDAFAAGVRVASNGGNLNDDAVRVRICERCAGHGRLWDGEPRPRPQTAEGPCPACGGEGLVSCELALSASFA